MKNAVLLHGKPDKDEYYDAAVPSPSNNHWFPWLQKQLLMRDILAQTPEIPQPFEPQYELWAGEFERFEVTPDTLLVGHSCGGGFLVRWLSEHQAAHAGRVVLVAPSLGLDWEHKGFFDFQIDPKVVERTAGITVMVADDDREGILGAAQQLSEAVHDIKIRRLESGGHFTLKHMGHAEFPELLEEVLA